MKIIQILQSSGINSFDQYDGYVQVDITLAAVLHWLRTSSEAQEYVFTNLFHAEMETGENNKEYNVTLKSKIHPAKYQLDNYGQNVIDYTGQPVVIPERADYVEKIVQADRVKTYKLTHVVDVDNEFGNQFVPPCTCKSYYKEVQRCFNCNAETHCTKQTTKDAEIVWVCNSCLSNSEKPAWQKLSNGIHMCNSCHAEKCQNHPYKNFSQTLTGTEVVPF